MTKWTTGVDVDLSDSPFGERTILTGGDISDNGDGTATISACTAWCHIANSDTAVGTFFTFIGDTSVSLTNLTTNFIFLDYNEGSPQVVVSTVINTYGPLQDHIMLGVAYRDDNALHIVKSTSYIAAAHKFHMHFVEDEYGAHRSWGIETTEVDVRKLNISTGALYRGIDRTAFYAGSSFDTNNSDTFSYWYWDGNLGGGAAWVEDTGETQISRTQYNDRDTGKASLTSHKYGVHWVFVDLDGEHINVVYGVEDYSANGAEEAKVPASLPDIVVGYGAIIAKIICQEGTDDLTITYPWTAPFVSSLATDHDLLGGVAASTAHTEFVLGDGTRTITVNSSAPGTPATGDLWIDTS